MLAANLLGSFGGTVSSCKDLVCQPEGPDVTRVQAALAEVATELKQAKSAIPSMVGYDFDIYDPQAMKRAQADFQHRLKVHVIDADDPKSLKIIRRMYGLYEATFPIAEEREQLDKLLMVLKRQNNILEKDSARQHWIVLETPEGEIIGGRYVSTFVIPEEASMVCDAVQTTQRMAKEFDGTQHLTYSFIDAKYRAMGLGDFTMRVAADVGRQFIARNKPGRDPASIDILRFCEQNNPLLMSVEDFLADTIGAKTDPFWRRSYYQKMGFREVECNYTQLPLRSPEQGGKSCEILMLLAKPLYGPASERAANENYEVLDADLVKFHIYNTFEHSFAAGQYCVASNADWQKQAGTLTGEVPVRPPLDFYNTGLRAWHMLNFSHTLKATGETNTWSLGRIMNLGEIPAVSPSAP